MNIDVIILGVITFLGVVIAIRTLYKIGTYVMSKFQKKKIKSII